MDYGAELKAQIEAEILRKQKELEEALRKEAEESVSQASPGMRKSQKSPTKIDDSSIHDETPEQKPAEIEQQK